MGLYSGIVIAYRYIELRYIVSVLPRMWYASLNFISSTVFYTNSVVGTYHCHVLHGVNTPSVLSSWPHRIRTQSKNIIWRHMTFFWEVTPSVEYPFHILSNITNEVTFDKDTETMRCLLGFFSVFLLFIVQSGQRHLDQFQSHNCLYHLLSDHAILVLLLVLL